MAPPRRFFDTLLGKEIAGHSAASGKVADKPDCGANRLVKDPHQLAFREPTSHRQVPKKASRGQKAEHNISQDILSRYESLTLLTVPVPAEAPKHQVDKKACRGRWREELVLGRASSQQIHSSSQNVQVLSILPALQMQISKGFG